MLGEYEEDLQHGTDQRLLEDGVHDKPPDRRILQVVGRDMTT